MVFYHSGAFLFTERSAKCINYPEDYSPQHAEHSARKGNGAKKGTVLYHEYACTYGKSWKTPREHGK